MILCTARGDILVGDENGDFKFILPDSPGIGFPIRRIISRTNGFVIADDSGRFKSYEQNADPKSPYQKSVFELQIGSDALAKQNIEILPITVRLNDDQSE